MVDFFFKLLINDYQKGIRFKNVWSAYRVIATIDFLISYTIDNFVEINKRFVLLR